MMLLRILMMMILMILILHDIVDLMTSRMITMRTSTKMMLMMISYSSLYTNILRNQNKQQLSMNVVATNTW